MTQSLSIIRFYKILQHSCILCLFGLLLTCGSYDTANIDDTKDDQLANPKEIKELKEEIATLDTLKKELEDDEAALDKALD